MTNLEKVPPRGVLMLAYWYPPENQSGALRPQRFCRYLRDFGYRSFVVAAPLSTPQPTDPGVWRAPSGKGVGSIWHKIADAAARLFQRLAPYNDRLEWFSPALRCARQMVSQRQVAAIFSTSPPVVVVVVALMLRWRFRLPWIADFRDPLVGNPFRARRLGRIYDKFLEDLVVRYADAVIVNTDSALQAMKDRHSKFGEKFHLIWNGYDPEDDLPMEVPAPGDHRVIAHFGTLYGGRHPGSILDAIDRLADRRNEVVAEIRVRLIGEVELGEAWISAPSAQRLLKKGMLEYSGGAIPRAQARAEMLASDYLLLLDINESPSGLQVPGKLFEYVRTGRPILAVTIAGSPVERLLARSGILHVCIYVGDSDAEVDRKLLEFMMLSTDPRPASEWFELQFNARAQTEALASLLDASIESRRRR